MWAKSCMLGMAGMMLLAGCEIFDTQAKISDADLKQAQYAEVKAMRAKGDTVLIDLRSPQKFAAGHIPGAINTPPQDMVANDARLAEARNIIVYAENNTDPLSHWPAKKLRGLGYSNVFDYDGGVEDWQKNGERLDSSPAASQPAGISH